MKKSLIALSLVSVFSVCNATAAVDPTSYVDAAEFTQAVREYANDNNITVNNAGYISDKTGLTVGKVEGVGNGDLEITLYKEHERNDGKPLEVDDTIKVSNAGNDQLRITSEKSSNVEPLPDPEVVTPENRAVENSNKIADIYEAGDAAAKYIETEGSKVASRSIANENRINKLEDSFKDMAARQDKFEDKLNKMDKKMDGVMAGTHAVTNARPMVAGGQTAFGVGTGFAGSAQAVAVGVAHNFKDSAWSVSATTNVSTGSGVKTQVSGGVGAHYVF